MKNEITGVNGPITGWLDGHTYLIGLMAYPIRHSMSPTMHNNSFAKLGLNFTYLCFEIGNDKLKGAVDAIRTLDMRGSNVSMPNKKKLFNIWTNCLQLLKCVMPLILLLMIMVF